MPLVAAAEGGAVRAEPLAEVWLAALLDPGVSRPTRGACGLLLPFVGCVPAGFRTTSQPEAGILPSKLVTSIFEFILMVLNL